MRRLLAVELTRLRWRRAVVLLVLAAAVLALVVLGFVVYGTRPLSEAEEARHWVYRDPLDLGEQRESGSGLGLGIVLPLLFLLVGTTFVGHDWATGSMSNQLLVEPRRGRVWVAKAAVVAAGAFVACLVLLVLYWTALWLVALERDIPPEDRGIAPGYGQAVLAALLAAAMALLGYGLTMLFRSTVATLGVLFAVVVGGAVLWSAVSFDHPRLSPETNLEAYLVGSSTYYDYDDERCYDDGTGDDSYGACRVTVSRADSLPYLGSIVLVVGAVSAVSFRRRDVP